MGTATFSVEQRGQKKGEKRGQAPICVGIISFFSSSRKSSLSPFSAVCPFSPLLILDLPR